MTKLINKTQNDFTIVSNTILKSTDLKFEEKGLYVYLLSKPDYWNFSAERIANESLERISSVKRILKALEDIGLLKRFKIKDDKGFFSGVDYHIYDKINPWVENPTTEFADDGLSNDGKSINGISGGGNPTNINNTVYNNTINNNIIDNNIVSEKNENQEFAEFELKNEKTFQKKVASKKRFSIPTIEEIQSYCQERNSPIDAIKFFNYYEAVGWKIGKQSMKSWKATIITWERNETNKANQNQNGNGTEQQPRFAGRQSEQQVYDAIQRELTNSYDPRFRE